MDLGQFTPLLILTGTGPGRILRPDERGWPRWLGPPGDEAVYSPLFPARATYLTAAVGPGATVHLGLWEDQGAWQRGPASGWQSLPAELAPLTRPHLFATPEGLHILGEGPGRQLQHWRQLSGIWRLERSWGANRWQATSAGTRLHLILGGDRPGQHWRWDDQEWHALGLDLPAGEPLSLLAAGAELDLAWLAKGRLATVAWRSGAWQEAVPVAGALAATDRVYLAHFGHRLALYWGRASNGFLVRYSENGGSSWSAAVHRPGHAWERPLRVISGADYPGPFATAVNWPPQEPPPLGPAELTQAIWPVPTREVRAANQPITPAAPTSYFLALDERLRRLENRLSQPPSALPKATPTAPPSRPSWWERLWHRGSV